MLNALRMVWIISRHYNCDERMVPLMDLIACEISEKVAIQIRLISNISDSDRVRISQAKKVLQSWHESYREQRELIFESGTESLTIDGSLTENYCLSKPITRARSAMICTASLKCLGNSSNS